MAVEDSEFQTELRGYKRSEVDEIISELRTELIQASKDRQGGLEELKVATETLAALHASSGEAVSPTYAGLGGRLEAVLRIAEEQSTRVIGQADIDAERMIAQSKLEASEILDAANREAQRLTQDASNSASNTLDGATASAEAIVTVATEEAARLKTESINEAAAIRGAVATESAKLRASAKRETEALRSEALREISELKVVTERELNDSRGKAALLSKDIEVERASHELTLRKITEEAALAKTTMEHEVTETTARLRFDNENQTKALARLADQARADLDAELSARRAEAERELLDAHQKAVELNNRFLTEAEEQLGETKDRLAGLRAEQKKIIAAIDAANRSGKNSAEKAALDTIAAAETRAAAIVRRGEEEATTRVAAAERRLVELRAERDTIADYIETLRVVVGKSVAVAKAPRAVPGNASPKASSSRKAAKQQDSAAS
jgi:cell division septum initiation protein DivIVA